ARLPAVTNSTARPRKIRGRRPTEEERRAASIGCCRIVPRRASDDSIVEAHRRVPENRKILARSIHDTATDQARTSSAMLALHFDDRVSFRGLTRLALPRVAVDDFKRRRHASVAARALERREHPMPARLAH